MCRRHNPRRTPKPTGAEFVREVRDVLADVPRFMTAPLYRRWHRRWGATDEEVAAAMPGDDLIERPQYRATRAISIAAPPNAVWPWLVQVGLLRGGFYADDLFDNLARPGARTILPEYQELKIGQWVPMSPTPCEVTAFKVAGFERWLLCHQPPLSTRSWTLNPVELADAGAGTRLATRRRIIERPRISACPRAPGRGSRLPGRSIRRERSQARARARPLELSRSGRGRVPRYAGGRQPRVRRRPFRPR